MSDVDEHARTQIRQLQEQIKKLETQLTTLTKQLQHQQHDTDQKLKHLTHDHRNLVSKIRIQTRKERQT